MVEPKNAHSAVVMVLILGHRFRERSTQGAQRNGATVLIFRDRILWKGFVLSFKIAAKILIQHKNKRTKYVAYRRVFLV